MARLIERNGIARRVDSCVYDRRGGPNGGGWSAWRGWATAIAPTASALNTCHTACPCSAQSGQHNGRPVRLSQYTARPEPAQSNASTSYLERLVSRDKAIAIDAAPNANAVQS